MYINCVPRGAGWSYGQNEARRNSAARRGRDLRPHAAAPARTSRPRAILPNFLIRAEWRRWRASLRLTSLTALHQLAYFNAPRSHARTLCTPRVARLVCVVPTGRGLGLGACSRGTGVSAGVETINLPQLLELPRLRDAHLELYMYINCVPRGAGWSYGLERGAPEQRGAAWARPTAARCRASAY